MTTRRRVLFLADSVSQLKPAYEVAEAFARNADWEVVGNLVPGKAAPSSRQLLDADLRCPVTAHSLGNLAQMGIFERFDALVAFLPGSLLYRLHAHVGRAMGRSGPRTRPAMVTGYNGVVYVGPLEGLLWRTGFDFICVNSRADHRRFSSMLEELGHSGERLVRTGYLLARREAKAPPPFAQMPSQDVLFATQAITPAHRDEREYILEGLRAYAEAFPDRKVYIKPRGLPGERTFHEERFHYAVLYDELFGRSKPENLLFGYGDLASYLDRVGLVLTVSSTAVIEALSHGVPGAVLQDFGIKESLGNHFFRTSGMLTTLPELLADQVPAAKPDWLEDNGFASDDSLDTLVDEVSSFVDEQDRTGRRAPMLQPFYSGRRAPFIERTVLPGRDKRPTRVPSTFERTLRKTRKLLLHPKQFVRDSRLPEDLLRGLLDR